ncbi:MAG: glycosyltransferase family 4 protein, partial [Parafilimonas sp.]
MNILHVCSNYYPSNGGPQYTLKHVSEKLIEYYNDKVAVATTDAYYGTESRLFKKVNPSFEILNGVEVNRFPYTKWYFPLIKYGGKIYGKMSGKSLPYSIIKKRSGLESPGIMKFMDNSAADAIMATTILYNFCDYPFFRFKTKNPKPFILYGSIHLHNSLPYEHPFLKRARACDCYIANTEFEKNELINLGIDGTKIVAIGSGIEYRNFVVSEKEIASFKQKNGIEEDDIVIGYIGRLIKGKGVAILLEAFKKIYTTNQKVKLLLAGATTDFVPQIKKIIHEKSLPVILIENFDEAQKPLLYNILNIFILASQSESFGVSFLEAWACKKPVVATDMGATASLLSEGTDSFLFPKDDVNDLVKKIEVLINN